MRSWHQGNVWSPETCQESATKVWRANRGRRQVIRAARSSAGGPRVRAEVNQDCVDVERSSQSPDARNQPIPASFQTRCTSMGLTPNVRATIRVLQGIFRRRSCWVRATIRGD